MHRFFLSLLCFCCLTLCFSQNTSQVNFVIRNLGINVNGHFKTVTITPYFNSNGTLLSIEGKVKVASIKTGIESRDNHLLKADYFDAEKHEYIILKSKNINKIGDGSYAMVAYLTIKGKTKQIDIKVNLDKANNTYKITSNFEINRKDFNIGSGSLIMSKTVKINVTHNHKL